ncbi:uncharacterized protein BXZ73DRAFT_90135 [Epithele typhae]|uniref:uncharacterized protein n=1 Tax=Epithele typhae TaxID=378194 RepID=UPI002007FBDA|nr:uncharacterized protein BXZ73DRAFT_90135 [Epithele typhae]KAH9931718.1 hypothetical protein BXZ73DRAFT_90135 [Epithele typhae]
MSTPGDDQHLVQRSSCNRDQLGNDKGSKVKSSDVYGEDYENAAIKYRTMVWWKVAALMLAATVSLGLLSIPSVFATVGMVAGCFLVVGLGAIATATGYIFGSFKLRYPHVHNMADAGEILAGPVGREVLGAAQVLFLVFYCGSHVLTGLIAFDTITDGASCSILWAAVTAIICLLLTIPRTLNGISYLSVVSFISILGSVLITMIGVGMFAYGGQIAFFTFIAEMRKPEDFPKALYMLQIADTTIYLIVGVAIYSFTGENTVSPALGNTGVTLRKVAYGVALPTIVIAGVIGGHVCAKLVFVRIFRRKGYTSRHMTSHSWTGWLTWIGICAAIWTAAFIIAELYQLDLWQVQMPPFEDPQRTDLWITCSWFTYGISDAHVLSHAQMAAFIMVAGLYASILGIIQGYRNGQFSGPFSCASQALI